MEEILLVAMGKLGIATEVYGPGAERIGRDAFSSFHISLTRPRNMLPSFRGTIAGTSNQA
jgi:hypothetical protein